MIIINIRIIIRMVYHKRCTDVVKHVKELICAKRIVLELQGEVVGGLNLSYGIQAKILNIIDPSIGSLSAFMNSLLPIFDNLTSGQSSLIPITPSQFHSMFSTLDVLTDAIKLVECDTGSERKVVGVAECLYSEAMECMFWATEYEVGEDQMAAEMTDVNGMVSVIAGLAVIGQNLPVALADVVVIDNVLKMVKFLLRSIKIYLKKLQCVLNMAFMGQNDIANGIAAETQVAIFGLYVAYLLTGDISGVDGSILNTFISLQAGNLVWNGVSPSIISGSIADYAGKLVNLFVTMNGSLSAPIGPLNTVISNECAEHGYEGGGCKVRCCGYRGCEERGCEERGCEERGCEERGCEVRECEERGCEVRECNDEERRKKHKKHKKHSREHKNKHRSGRC